MNVILFFLWIISARLPAVSLRFLITDQQTVTDQAHMFLGQKNFRYWFGDDI